MFHRYVRIVLIEMEQKLIVMCFEDIYHELRTIYSMAIFKGSGKKTRWLFPISCNPIIITRTQFRITFLDEIHFLTCSMAIFKGSGEKNIANLGVSRISRFRKNKIYEMTVKKIIDQPDLLVIEGFTTLLENGQVLLSNSKIFNFTVTCLGSRTFCVAVSKWQIDPTPTSDGTDTV